jgi:hypothetical protein
VRTTITLAIALLIVYLVLSGLYGFRVGRVINEAKASNAYIALASDMVGREETERYTVNRLHGRGSLPNRRRSGSHCASVNEASTNSSISRGPVPRALPPTPSSSPRQPSDVGRHHEPRCALRGAGPNGFLVYLFLLGDIEPLQKAFLLFATRHVQEKREDDEEQRPAILGIEQRSLDASRLSANPQAVS